jgi:hypothetical protein
VSAYRVETEKEPCEACGQGGEFMIIAPDGIGLSTTYVDLEEAEEQADELNRAYDAGLAAAVATERT